MIERTAIAGINWKKINLYILFVFAYCWSIALAMKLAHIEYGSIASFVIIGGLYMPGPALATFVIQKYIYKEGFREYGWRYDRNRIKWHFASILIFCAIIFLTLGIIGLLGNTNIENRFGRVDFSRENFSLQFTKLLEGKLQSGKIKLPNFPPWLFFIMMMAEGIMAGLTVNIPFMFGEEFGWRGLMLRETQKMGFFKSNLFIGFVWGAWHWPVILMGHNYPNHPYSGLVMMCLMTISLAPLFAYVRLKTGSILGACLLHGMINGTAAVFTLYIANGNEMYSSIAGWAGVIACTLITVSIYILDPKFVQQYTTLDNEIAKKNSHDGLQVPGKIPVSA